MPRKYVKIDEYGKELLELTLWAFRFFTSHSISSRLTVRPVRQLHSWRLTPLNTMRLPFKSICRSFSSNLRRPTFSPVRSTKFPSRSRAISASYRFGCSTLYRAGCSTVKVKETSCTSSSTSGSARSAGVIGSRKGISGTSSNFQMSSMQKTAALSEGKVAVFCRMEICCFMMKEQKMSQSFSRLARICSSRCRLFSTGAYTASVASRLGSHSPVSRKRKAQRGMTTAISSQ